MFSRARACITLRGWTFFCNFEVKFEIRGISDENEAGTFSTNSVRDFTSSLLPLWITDASIVLPSLTRRLAGEIRQKAMPWVFAEKWFFSAGLRPYLTSSLLSLGNVQTSLTLFSLTRRLALDERGSPPWGEIRFDAHRTSVRRTANKYSKLAEQGFSIKVKRSSVHWKIYIIE